jgi:PPOX class probable F420-dependent enzyme
VSKPPLPPEAVAMLSRPNPCVIATLRADGTPVSTATWYLWEDGRILVNMDEGRMRLQHLRNDPRVALTVLGADDWYHQVTLRGRVVSIEDDAELADIDRISRHYLGNDPRVTLTVLDQESWYTHLSIIGRVTEMHEDKELADIDRLSVHYTGRPYPQRRRARVSAWIEVDRWHGWGALKDSSQSMGL